HLVFPEAGRIPAAPSVSRTPTVNTEGTVRSERFHMAARSTWKGFIRLSLVSIPVKAYTATPSQAGEVRLNQLHAGCNSRIKYQKVCPIHGELKSDEIVSGYEYSKDQYVVIDPNELDKLRTEDSKALSIQEFVPSNSIDP